MPFHKTLIVNRKSLIAKKKPGLTLIELLVVVALIGILSSFGVYSYQSSQKKARDAQRKSDLQQIKKAMEAAKNDCVGGSYYPVIVTAGSGSYVNRFNNLITHLKDTNLSYLDSTITDPLNSGSNKYGAAQITATTPDVCPDNSGSMSVWGVKNFALSARLETKNDPDAAKSANLCFVLDGIQWNVLIQGQVNGGIAYFVCND